MIRTDDPIRDFDRWDEEQSRWLESRPECADCGEPIQEDHCFEYNGEYICPRCNEECHRKEIGSIVW